MAITRFGGWKVSSDDKVIRHESDSHWISFHPDDKGQAVHYKTFNDATQRLVDKNRFNQEEINFFGEALSYARGIEDKTNMNKNGSRNHSKNSGGDRTPAQRKADLAKKVK